MAETQRGQKGSGTSLFDTTVDDSMRSMTWNPFNSILNADSPIVRGEEKSKVFKRRSTNVNLQRSLQLLDEAVGSPSMGGTGASSPGNLLRPGAYTPRRATFDTTGTSVAKFPQMVTPGNQKMVDNTMMMSFNMTPGQLQGVDMETTLLGPDVTTTNVTLLLQDDPGLAASISVFQAFKESLCSLSAVHQVFDLVTEYEEICTEQVIMLRKLVMRTAPMQQKFEKTIEVLFILEQERSTWQLIGSLFRDRLESKVKNEMEVVKEENMAIDDTPVRHASDQNVANALFERDAKVRQAQMVIDWLENCARNNESRVSENVKFYSDNAVAWENTLHRLQNKSKGLALSSDRPFVEEMDPDAPVRENKMLDDLDKEDEGRLLQYLFTCVRAGELDKAQEMCVTCGQAWRAATLEGWRLFHDPNYQGLGPGGEVAPIQGNLYRDVWKAVCWKMAQEPKYNVYERALYASMSGNLQGILPACKSWSDHLWAYFKTLVDIKVEQELRMQTTIDRSLQSLPDEYWDRQLEPETAFLEIDASLDEGVRKEAQQPYHKIQKYVILGQIDDLIEFMYNLTQVRNKKPSCHLIRFFSHLVLFLKSVGLSTKEELCNAILESYVEELIADRRKELLAAYVATLPPDAQIVWYAKFLQDIHGTDERRHCLHLAEEAGLDIPRITKTVVENIRKLDTGHLMDLEMGNVNISDEDRQKIEAIDWLVFDPSQRAEALKQANAVMRTFISMKKHMACREVFDKLPADTVDVIYKTWHYQTGATELLPEDDNAIREYMCVKALLDAVESYNDWFRLFNNGKPTEPSLPTSATFTEKVAHEHRMKQYDTERDRWQHGLTLQTKTTKDRMYNVLLFADGGWMVDQTQTEMPDDSRLHQMAMLRQMCIPYTCMALQHVLHHSQIYTECLQLADVIASEQYKLYQVFNKTELQQFLQRLRESSLVLLDQSRDPLGYEML